MTTAQIEKLIEKAYTEMGIEPREADFGGKVLHTACAIGAAYWAKTGHPVVGDECKEIADVLGCSLPFVWGTAIGFDGGTGCSPIYKAGVLFGRRMRRKWLKKAG